MLEVLLVLIWLPALFLRFLGSQMCGSDWNCLRPSPSWMDDAIVKALGFARPRRRSLLDGLEPLVWF